MDFKHNYTESVISAFNYDGENPIELMFFVRHNNPKYSITFKLDDNAKVLVTSEAGDITRVFTDDMVFFKEGRICTLESRTFGNSYTRVKYIRGKDHE